ncbi:MAG: DNA polymerase III subunit gamma and tau [Candidatus Nanopelagicales bacterium]
MALALYRTYRPGSLAEVIGQEHVTLPLARALESGRIHHAYLFSGPRGCGKTSTARILARSLNCEQGPTAEPCGTCRSCAELAPNGPGSMDVIELDAATHRGIDDAKELREKAIYAPAASRFKVYIVDEAHQLTNEAANALLKVVEEPPPHLRFIFATTEPDKIIPTIRSRTFHYGFRLVPARILCDHLAAVCRAEGVAAEPPALAVVARAGAGSVRDSLSVLGQLIAGAGPSGLTYADAVASLGMTDAALIDAFVEALAAGSGAAMFTVVDRVINAGHDPRRFVTDVLDRLRDLIFLRADPEAVARGLVDVPDDTGAQMVTQAASLEFAQLSRAADLVNSGLSDVRGATAPRLQLELLCARLALTPADSDIASLSGRVERLERGAAGMDPSRPQPGASRGGSGASPGAAPVVGRVSRTGSAPAPERPAAAAPAPEAPAERPESRADRPATATAGPDSVARFDARPSSSGAAAGWGQGGPERGQVRQPPRRPDLRAQAPGRSKRGSPDQAGGQGVSGPGPAADGAEAAEKPAGGAAGVAAIQAAWDAVLERLSVDSRVAWTAFHSARPVSLSSGSLAVAVAEAGNVRAIAQRGHDERLRQAIIDVLGLDVSIDVLHQPDASQDPGSAARPATGRGASGSGTARQDARHQQNRSTASTGNTGPRGAAEGAGTQVAHRLTGAGAAVDLVREARSAGPDLQPDEPSSDDPDLEQSAADGLALIARELGARPISDIEHK